MDIDVDLARWIGGAGYLAGYLATGKADSPAAYATGIIAAAVALTADWLESLANYRLTLAPGGNLGERRRSIFLDKLLNVRLFFLVVSAIGLVFYATKAVPWLMVRVPAWEVIWLAALGLIAVRVSASWSWSAAPMHELGTKATSWLLNEGYAARFSVRARDQSKPEPPDVQEERRLWVRRALLRDLVGFLPASFLAILFGWWLFLPWVLWAFGERPDEGTRWGGLQLDRECWMPAAILASVYVIVAVIENRRQLGRYASGSSGSFSLTKWLFRVGIAGFVAAIVALATSYVLHVLMSGGSKEAARDLSRAMATLPAVLGLLAALFALSGLRAALKKPLVS
jgi:hypothetical protein